MTPDQRQKLIELAQLGDADSLHAALRMRGALAEASDQEIHLSSFRLFGEYLRTNRKMNLNASYDGFRHWRALGFMIPQHFRHVDSVYDRDFSFHSLVRADVPDGFYRIKLLRSPPLITRSVDTRGLAQQMGFSLD
jgi:hypothetical protein